MKAHATPLVAMALASACMLAGSRGAAQMAPSTSESSNVARELASLQMRTMSRGLLPTMSEQAWGGIESALRSVYPSLDRSTRDELYREYERHQAIVAAEMMAEAPAIYARYFTADELRDLVAFYRSPLGAKMLDVMPRAMTDILDRELPRIQSRQVQMKENLDAILRNRGYLR